MKDSAISVSHLSFSYLNTPILEDVHFAIAKGEFVGIMGPNGGGKTTLFKLLMGFLQPAQGMIQVLGLSPEKSRLKIGYVPQVHHIDRDFPITVLELILLGAPVHRFFYSSAIKEQAKKLMEELGLLDYQSDSFSSLSGGLAQRALFARALLSDPEILLLDEPLANIDPKSSQIMISLLETFKGKKTILMVTHDLKTIIERVDRILCIQKGVSSLLAKEVCEHFALGLYHTPLIDLPTNHFNHKSHAEHCIHH